MDIILAILSVLIGWTLMFLVGNYFGQGVMIGCLLASDDPNEVVVGKSWYYAFQRGLEHEKGLFDRLVVKLVLAGVNSYGKSREESGESAG